MNEPNPETHFIKIRLNAEIAPELFNPKKVTWDWFEIPYPEWIGLTQNS